MKYRVIGVQYYVYDTEAESEEDAREGFRTMMNYGTSSEIDCIKSGEPFSVVARPMED